MADPKPSPEPKEAGKEPERPMREPDEPGKRTEEALTRLSAAIGAVTAVSTLIITLASDAVSAPWLLAGATVMSAICLTVLLFSLGVSKFFRGAAVTCGVVVSLGWIFVYREDIWFSKALCWVFGAPRVVIDESVARSLVSSKTGSVSRDQRFMSVLDRVIEEPHHTQVLSASDPTPEHALLRVTGMATPSRSSLVLAVPDSARSPWLTESKARSLETIASLIGVVAGDERFLASGFDDGRLRLSIASSPQEVSEPLLMGYHTIIGVRIFRAGKGNGLDHLSRLHEFRDLVTQEQVRGIPWLADALLFSAHVALAGGDNAGAAAFIDDGRRLLPDDARLRVANAYLKVRAGNTSLAEQGLKGEPPDSADQGLAETLRALVDMKAGDTWSAIAHLEAAADGLSTAPAPMIFSAHMLVAQVAAEAYAGPEERGAIILRHTSAAEQVIAGVVLADLLSGFGSALIGNTIPAEVAFARARREAKTPEEIEACDYWEAWGLAQSRSGLDKAIRMLDELERKGAATPRELGLLAELNAQILYGSNDLARDVDSDAVGRAFQVAKRALGENKLEVRSHRVLGLYEAARTASMKGPERSELIQSALEHFATALREGGDDSRVYAQMSWLYRELAQTAEAKRTERRAYDVSCRCEHDVSSCAIRDVAGLLEKKDVVGAERRTNDLIRWLTNHPNLSSAWGNSILNTLALMFYQKDERDIAEELYGIIRRNVAKQKNPQPAMTGLVDCNEAFIYVDAGHPMDAERLFRRGLGATTSADCQAGLAIALKQLGRDQEAGDYFSKALQSDPNYGNLNVLKESYYWSDTARGLAASLGIHEQLAKQ